MIVQDDYTRFAWVYLLKKKGYAYERLEQFLAGVREDGEIETLRSDSGDEFASECFVVVCNCHRVRRELYHLGKTQHQRRG